MAIEHHSDERRRPVSVSTSSFKSARALAPRSLGGAHFGRIRGARGKLLQNLTDLCAVLPCCLLRTTTDAARFPQPMEETMQGIRVPDSQQSLVTAIFKDIALSFELPQGATLEDLASYLADLGELHGGKPLAVDIQLLC